MRHRRELLSFAFVTSAFAAATVACAADLTVSSSLPDSGAVGTTDAATTDGSAAATDAGDATTAPLVSALASDVTTYLGHTVTVDGSASTGPAGFTYAWTFVSGPATTAVTTASLKGTASAMATFVPDGPGTYTLDLTITSGTARDVHPVRVHVIDPPVFFLDVQDGADGGNYATFRVVGANSTDAGAVSCFANDGGPGPYGTAAIDSSQAGIDWWEAPAGQPSRLAFAFQDQDPTPAPDGGAGGDGGAAGTTTVTVLSATTSASTCDTKPARLDTMLGSGTNTYAFQQPRFSPSGNRVAYVRTERGASAVYTVGFDGAARRSLGALDALPDGGPDPDGGLPTYPQTSIITGAAIRPVWINETTVAWLQARDATNWQIVSAPDGYNSATTVIMTCTGATPTQFDMLANGDAIVSQDVTKDGGAVSTNLYVYAPDATTKACSLVNNLTHLVSGASTAYARDFALSPDKGYVAYASDDGTGAGQFVRLTAVNGATSPRVVGSPAAGTYRGPRWIGAGGFLTWGIDGAQFNVDAGADGGDAGTVYAGNAVAVAPVGDGGVAHPVATTSASSTTYAIGNGNGVFQCSFFPARGPGATFFGLFGLGAVGVAVARRRRAVRGERPSR